MLTVTIKYFGMVLECTQVQQESFPLLNSLSTIKDVEQMVIKKYPALQNITYNIAQNQRIATKKELVNNGDELAFLPPFAGG